MIRTVLVGGLVAVAMPMVASAQRFNIDLDVNHGAPSNAFGGAAVKVLRRSLWEAL